MQCGAIGVNFQWLAPDRPYPPVWEDELVSRELRGRFKEPLWVRPTCTDNSEALPLGRKARRDFKKTCRDEGGNDVASIDTLDEAFELGDHPVDPEA
jgi:hypothetical protein